MALPLKENITVLQGATFTRTFRWDDGTPVFKAITGIDQVAPVSVTCVGHGVPSGWPVAVVSVKGMSQINNPNPDRTSGYTPAEPVDVDTLILPFIDASSFKAYQSGGYIRYRKPVDLTGFTARMKIKKSKRDTEALVSLTSPADITINTADYTITVVISATVTEALTTNNGVYDLEMVSPTGQVFRLVEGTMTLSTEATV